MRKYPSATVLIAILVSAGACQTGGSSPSGAEADLNAYVTEYLRDLYRDTWDRRARYSLALADLNGDGAEEALVHVRGGHCGTVGAACWYSHAPGNHGTFTLTSKVDTRPSASSPRKAMAGAT